MVNEGGRRLRAWRLRRGLSQFDLAKMIDITPTVISHYERGQRVPDRRVAIRFRDLAGVPVDAWDAQAAG